MWMNIAFFIVLGNSLSSHFLVRVSSAVKAILYWAREMLQRLNGQVVRISSTLKTAWSWTRGKAEVLRMCLCNARSRIYAWYGECKKKSRRKQQLSYFTGNCGLRREYVGNRVKGIILYYPIFILVGLIGQAKLDLRLPPPTVLLLVIVVLLVAAFWLFKDRLDKYYILRNYSMARALVITFVTFGLSVILFTMIHWPEPLLTTSFVSTSPDEIGETTVFTNITKGLAPIAYKWYLGDGSTSSVHHTHIYAVTGTFQVFLIARNPIATDVFSDTVEILPPGSVLPPSAAWSNPKDSFWISLMRPLLWSLIALFLSSSLIALVTDSKVSLPFLPNAEFLEAMNALKSHLRALCEGKGLVWLEKKPDSEIEQCLEWVGAAVKKLEDLKRLAASDRPMICFVVKLREDLGELEAALQVSRDAGDVWKKYFSNQPPMLNEVETKRRECIERLVSNKLV